MAYEKIGRSAWAVFCCLVSGGGLVFCPIFLALFFLPYFSCPIFLALFFLPYFSCPIFLALFFLPYFSCPIFLGCESWRVVSPLVVFCRFCNIYCGLDFPKVLRCLFWGECSTMIVRGKKDAQDGSVWTWRVFSAVRGGFTSVFVVGR